MPQIQYEKLKTRKFTEEIIFKTLALSNDLRLLQNKIESFNKKLALDLIWKASDFYPDIRGLTSLLYPIYLKVSQIEQYCALLIEIKTSKQALIEDTRDRRVFIRTGNLKRWIESQLPMATFDLMETLLTSQFDILVSLLQRLRFELSNSQYADSLYTGKQYNTRDIELPFSNRLLSTLIAAQQRENSPFNSFATIELLPAAIKQHHQVFCNEFSFFNDAAKAMYNTDPDIARTQLREMRVELQEEQAQLSISI